MVDKTTTYGYAALAVGAIGAGAVAMYCGWNMRGWRRWLAMLAGAASIALGVVNLLALRAPVSPPPDIKST